MTVLDHPAMLEACRRGDQAARMVPVACDLALLVRDSDREMIGEAIAAIPAADIPALLVVMAAMIPVEDVSEADLLAWVGFDEYGRLLPTGERPQVAARLRKGGPPVAYACGTYSAYARHKYRGELIDDDCREAAREYWRARKQQRPAGKAGRTASGKVKTRAAA